MSDSEPGDVYRKYLFTGIVYDLVGDKGKSFHARVREFDQDCLFERRLAGSSTRIRKTNNPASTISRPNTSFMMGWSMLSIVLNNQTSTRILAAIGI